MSVTADCRCFTCGHPSETNAPARALHAVRHEEFAELLAERTVRPLSPVRRIQVIAQEMDPGCAPIRSRRTGACLSASCFISMSHPAH